MLFYPSKLHSGNLFVDLLIKSEKEEKKCYTTGLHDLYVAV